VKNQAYYFEIKDIVTQFVAAFNNVVINRYNKDKSVADRINVRYVYSPKDRVLHDLVNKSQHISLPVVAVSISSIARDENRVFNKILGHYETKPNEVSSKFLPSPIPINIGMKMSIMTRYQTDLDQILSNFIPYNNPYIIISWKVPSELSSSLTEIRSEVLWDGNIAINYPNELQPNQPARVSADTSFTIKGWIFPGQETEDGKNILHVSTNFTTVSGFEYI
tara:strand:- start:339 stop:1004 length:666 start_codon:yes stop_codon:yes gene_type:complete